MATTVIEEARTAIMERVSRVIPVPEIPTPPDASLLFPSQARVWAAAVRQAEQQRDTVLAMMEANRRYGDLVLPVMERYEPIKPPTLPNGQMWPYGLVEHDHEPAVFTNQLIDPSREPTRWDLERKFCDEVGLFEQTTQDNRRLRGCVWYAEPIPEQALRRYQEAKASGLFDTILVMAPNANAFIRNFSDPRYMRYPDPIMVGVVGGINTDSKGKKTLAPAGSTLFYIASWDLDEDIAFCDALRERLGVQA